MVKRKEVAKEVAMKESELIAQVEEDLALKQLKKTQAKVSSI